LRVKQKTIAPVEINVCVLEGVLNRGRSAVALALSSAMPVRSAIRLIASTS
jgi:hypothetical protein